MLLMTAALPAGRELDALVAEKVFPPGHGFDHDNGPDGWCRRCQGDGGPCRVPPPFSTDIAAAWLVVERLRARRGGIVAFVYSVQAGQHGCRIGEQLPGDSIFTMHNVIAEEVGSTEAEAICRAALRAVEVSHG